MHRIALSAMILGLFASAPAAASDVCFPASSPEASPGFDFTVDATVTGPDALGMFTYEYRVSRVGHGDVDYGTPTHLGLLFTCASRAASTMIRGGRDGIEVATSQVGVCNLSLPSQQSEFHLTASDESCGNTGLEIAFCAGAFAPGVDGVPEDDAVLTVRFQSLADPAEGLWYIEGARSASREAVSTLPSRAEEQGSLTASAVVPVPSCLVAVPVENLSWGLIKQSYP